MPLEGLHDLLSFGIDLTGMIKSKETTDTC